MKETRIAKAKAIEEAYAKKQQAELIAKGIISEGEVEKTPKRRVLAQTSAWDFNKPKVYRPHSCLFLNSYQKTN